MTTHENILPYPLTCLAALQACMNGAHFAAMPMLVVLLAAAPDGGAALAGTVLSVYFLLSRIGPLLVAPLAERFGLWKAVTAGLCLRGAAFLMFPLMGPGGALIAGCLFGVGQALHEAGAYGVIGRQAARERTRLLVLNGQALNLGCVIGPVIGAGLALWSPETSFIAAGLTLIVLGIWSATTHSPLLRVPALPYGPLKTRGVFKDHRFLLLCIALIPFWAVFAQLFAAFPMLASQLGGSAAWANSILVVNGVTGILALALVARPIEQGRTLPVLFIGLTLAFVTIAGTGYMPTLTALLILVVVFSFGESFVMAASDILTGDHADGQATAIYFGVLNASAGIGAALGSYIGTMYAYNPRDGMIALACLGLLSIFPIAGYAINRSRGVSADA